MASFYRENNGKWTCSYHAPGEDGKMKRASKRGFAREKDARIWYNTIAANIDAGIYTDAGKLTVAQWLDRFLSAYCAHLEPSTQRGYKNSVEKHLVPRIGAYKLRDLQPVMVQQCINDLAKSSRPLSEGKTKPYAASFVKQVHLCLHAALDYAVRDGLIARNPAQYTDLPKAQAPKREYCTPEQVRAVLSDLADSPYLLPIMLCISAGLRRGEALGLRWSDIDLDARTATIDRQVVISDRDIVCKSLKTECSARTVPLPETLIPTLKEHKKKQTAQKLTAGLLYKDQGFVCADEAGSPMRPDIVSRAAKIAIDRAAAGLTLHDLRHTYATLLRQSGVPIEVISSLLGHADVSTTYSFYVGEDDTAKKKAAAKINTVLQFDQKKKA